MHPQLALRNTPLHWWAAPATRGPALPSVETLEQSPANSVPQPTIATDLEVRRTSVPTPKTEYGQSTRLIGMKVHHALERQVAEIWDPATWCDVTAVVAVSGGADSVGLLRCLHALSQPPRRLAIAHFNHGLRGEESERDERFVRHLSEQLDVPLEIGHAAEACSAGSDGVEAAARKQRYDFLCRVADRLGARYVATAHTADDQAETILHRIIRGTGLAGLAGIPATRRLSPLTTVVRPLLTLARIRVREYLSELQQHYREDSSNQQTVFTRNRIRHELLPNLTRQYNSQVAQALIRLGHLAYEAQAVIAAHVEPLVDQCIACRTASRVELTCSALVNHSPFLIREVFLQIWKTQHWPRQDMGDAKWRQLCDLACTAAAAPASATLPGRIQVEVNRGVMTLRRDEDDAPVPDADDA